MADYDGDSGGADASGASYDGDDGEPLAVAPRTRGPGQRPVEIEDTTRGKSSLFFISAEAGSLWHDDFSKMLGLDCDFADSAFGDGNNYLIGIIHGYWQFAASVNESASVDERIFMDLCGVHHRCKEGFIVYRAEQRIVFETPRIVQMPTNPHSLLHQCGGDLIQCWADNQFLPPQQTCKEWIRQVKGGLEVSTMPYFCVSMCPKAAVYGLSGLDVWHAVAVKKKVFGTKTIGGVPKPAQIKILKANFAAQQEHDGSVEKAQPKLNAFPFDVVLDWISSGRWVHRDTILWIWYFTLF